MTDDTRRTRSKPRKRRAQNRSATPSNKQAATRVRAQKVAKRRRRKVEEVVAKRALPKTPRTAARVRGRSSPRSRKPERAGRGR